MASYKLKVYKIEELLNWKLNTQLLKSNFPDLFYEMKNENVQFDLRYLCNKFKNESIAFNYIIPELRVVVTKKGETILKLTNVDLLKIFDRDYTENVLIKIEQDFLIIILQFTAHQSGGIAIFDLNSSKLISFYQDEFGPEQLFFLPTKEIFVGYSLSLYFNSNFDNFFTIDSFGHFRFVDFQKTQSENFEVLFEEPLLNKADTLFGIGFDEDVVRLKNSTSELYYRLLEH